METCSSAFSINRFFFGKILKSRLLLEFQSFDFG
jgi:hypothetical protein